MAERRMFAKAIVESDAFLDMPLSTQSLYFHLGMLADDDGFVSSPKKIIRMINANEDDLKILITKRFVLGFETGVIVIKHWKVNNYLRNDRYKKTVYLEEMSKLQLKENGSYTEIKEMETIGIPNGYQWDTQDRLGKDSIGKDRLGKDSSRIIKYYENNIGTLTPNMVEQFLSYQQNLNDEMIEKAIDICCERNKRNMSYLKAILNDWINKGYKNLSDLENDKKTNAKKEDDFDERVRQLKERIRKREEENSK